MAQQNVNVQVKGSVIWIGVDTAHPTDAMSKSGKSRVVGSSEGLLAVEVEGKTFRVMAGVYAPLPKADVYAAELATATKTLVDAGMTPAKAAEAAKAIVHAPKPPKADKATVATALEKARTTGIAPAETPVTPPPAKPGKSRVEVQIAPRKSR
jgi:hypothetical protein